MRIFTLIWCGQLASSMGSYMTFFALTLWTWEQTESATALALITFCLQLSQIPTTLFAGLVVDRFNRKHLMLFGDAINAVATCVVGFLHLTQQLQIWHLYLVAAIAGSFMQIQVLAYQASMAVIVPKSQYTRANAMGATVHYGSTIVGPALAGSLYPAIGLSGIIGIDLTTFGIAFLTLLAAPIPNPVSPSKPSSGQREPLTRQLTFGLRHILRQPSLKALLLLSAMFTFAHDLGATVSQPMILARSGGDAQVLASVSAAAGVGGVAGAVIISLWGGPKQRIRGVLGGMLGAGLSKMVFGLGRSLPVWVPAQVSSSLNFPLLGSCRGALWMESVTPQIQGRIFSAKSLVFQIASLGAVVCAGPLADQVFEPAMQTGAIAVPFLTTLFGRGAGSGMAIMYTFCSLGLVLVAIWGMFNPYLKRFDASSDTSSTDSQPVPGQS
ncbi:MAG: MFS transporter [Cyanophyceae cyanobacterium]